MVRFPVVPAIIPSSAAAVRELCAKLAFAPELHLDVVDGHFVPHISWPYEPSGTLSEVKSETDAFTLEVDLMVKDPLPLAHACVAAGADMLIFHIETIEVLALRSFSEQYGVTVGVSFHGDTALTAIEPYLEYADYIQCMGIRTIGAQGLPFDERALTYIKELVVSYPAHIVSVDGGVNKDTIPRLREAGASRFICGSSVVGALNPALAYSELSALIN